MDRAPLIALTGQAATTRMHKESHQYLDLVELFRTISKYTTSIIEPDIVAEVIRKACKTAEAEKPGVSFVELPENIAKDTADDKIAPLKVQSASPAAAPDEKIEQAKEINSNANYPIVMAVMVSFGMMPATNWLRLPKN